MKLNLFTSLLVGTSLSVFTCTSYGATSADPLDSTSSTTRGTPLATSVNLGKTAASTIELNPITLDNQLQSLHVDTNGVTGRYAIENRTIAPTRNMVASLLKGQTSFESLSKDEIQNFLICISAALQAKQSGEFTENHNVLFLNDCFLSYNEPDLTEPLAFKDLLSTYSQFKATLARKILPRSISELYDLSKIIHNDLIDQKKRMHFVTVMPENKIPYVLLLRNSVTGLYEFPEQKEGTTEQFPGQIIAEMGVPVPTDLSYHIDSLKSAVAISVVNPVIDSSLRLHYGLQERMRQEPNYLLVRLCNLRSLAEVLRPFALSTPSAYAGLTSSSELYTVVGTKRYLLAPSVLMGQDMLWGLLGFLGRTRDFSIENIASHWLRPAARAPISPPAVSAIATQASVTFTPVELSDVQINLITEIAQSLPTRLNPQRPGTSFEPVERGVATAITQAAPSSEDGCMTALCIVFSQERARELLNATVDSIGEGEGEGEGEKE